MISIDFSNLKDVQIVKSEPYDIVLQKIIDEYKNKSNEANLSYQYDIGLSYFYISMGLTFALTLYKNAIQNNK